MKKRENKQKKLKLKPSLREKNRYLLFEYFGEGKDIKGIIDKAILDFIGISGYAKACPKIIKLSRKNKKVEGILAFKRKELDKVKASLLFSGIKVKKVSGTINKLTKTKTI